MPVELINQHPDLPDSVLKHCRNTSQRILGLCDVSGHQLNIVLTTDAAIADLNSRYRHHDKATNVLSFPFDENNEFPAQLAELKELGDVIISYDRAIAEAGEYGCGVQDRMDWLIAHGVLHLLGYDHEKSEKDADIMDRKERELLQALKSR